MSEFVSIGVVGCGSIAIRGILPHLSQPDLQDRVRLAAVCDPAPGRAEAAAREFGVPGFFQSYEELLERGEVDAVSIASPIGLHYEQGMMALHAGKHIHFNKTMTTTVSEADEVIEAAAASGLQVVASPGEMLRPHNQRIRQLIAEGALGTLTWASGGAAFGRYHENERVRGGDSPLTNVDPSWYFRSPGGGPLYDMTVYPLHTLTGVLGPAKAVTALSGVRIAEREFGGRMMSTDADDNSFMLLDFGGALVGVVYGAAAGNLNPGLMPSFFGTKGAIAGLRLNGEPFDYPGREEAEAHASGVEVVLPHVTGVHKEIEEQHVFEDVMQLIDWVRDGTPSIATAEHARHVIEIIEAAYRSARTGQRQELATAF